MMSLFSELWAFMRVRKKWWLAPILVTMVLPSFPNKRWILQTQR